MIETKPLRDAGNLGFQSPAPTFPQPRKGVTAKGGVTHGKIKAYESRGRK